ncbi:MAG: 30S ribosomal protein S2 [Desulfurococcaceae archaeon]|nr:30S ribosomal protein S2 [Desulfurococcaceae archaeon]
MSSEYEKPATTIELLVPVDKYLSAGVHIGTHVCTKYMEPFVYKVRPDGVYILDVRKIDERLRIAGKFLAMFEPAKIAVVSARLYGRKPALKMCQYLQCRPFVDRFLPGTFTNPALTTYFEPAVVLVTDPRADAQAVKEASEIGIPVVAFADTDNRTENVDLVIPANNKGRKSLALLYWILTRQIMRERGAIPANADLPEPPSEFEAPV